MRRPLAIMAFNRPYYLYRVLKSIRGQLESNRPVYAFLDGHRTENQREVVDHCETLFKDLIPSSQLNLFRSPVNLGVGFNAKRLHDTVLSDYSSYIYLEDDLLPNSYFLRQSDNLADQLSEDPIVGMTSLFSANETRRLGDSYEKQHENRHQLIYLENIVSYTMERRVWEKIRPEMLEYYDILNESPTYRERNSNKIKQWFLSKGMNHGQAGCSSQDNALMATFLKAGFVKVSTYTVNCEYIGRIGEHSTVDSYNASGWKKIPIYDREVIWWNWNDEVYKKIKNRINERYY